MSSVAPRFGMSLWRSASSTVNATAGPSGTTGQQARCLAAMASNRGFGTTTRSQQAVAVDDRVFVPMDQDTFGAGVPERFLVNVSTPLPTTSPHCIGGPVASIKAHLASSSSSFLYRPGLDAESPVRQGFQRLMTEVRKSETMQGGSGLGKWFWAERASGGEQVGMKVCVDEVVSDEALMALPRV